MNEEGLGVVIVYDGQCPLCSRYVTMMRLRKAFGEVRLVDARSEDPYALQARHLFDMDEGMAALIAGRWWHGADCVNVLALASGPSHKLNRLLAAIFSSPARAARFYPLLKQGRNVLLHLLRRPKIGEAGGSGADLRRPG